MWIYQVPLLTVLYCFGVDWSHGLEKDIEVNCLDAEATALTEGGVIAGCAFQGLTRTSTIGPWLFQMANVLQGVNASHNHIKRVSKFPVLPRVLTLTLQHNSIREIEPRAFTGLENLQNLDLSFNSISGHTLREVLVGKKGPERFEPLPIRVLSLSQNNISTLEPSLFSHLLYLRDLHLDYNPLVIDEGFSASLRELPELKLLNLAGTGLKSLPEDAFFGLSLTSLLLNGNQLTQVPDLRSIGGSLRLLNINQNPIEELNSSSFLGLRSLSEVVASGMPKLTTIRDGTFSGLQNIRTISCSYNPQLVSIEEQAFWDHNAMKRSPLTEVYLNNNALQRINRHLLPWVTVSKVTLDGNRWVCDCRLHWLANILKGRSTAIDRMTELKCWDPSWLNGTELVVWKIDTKSRYENYACEQENKQRLEEIKPIKTNTVSNENETSQGSSKLYYLIIVAGVTSLVVIVVSVIACKRYKTYRPIYHVEKMSSPLHNEMKYMTGNLAEKTHLVP